ncbi:MAG: hypothetical protein ACI9UN_000584 [Granulosicoccus sp.]
MAPDSSGCHRPSSVRARYITQSFSGLPIERRIQGTQWCDYCCAWLLAVKWNLGEENDFPRVELDKHADYLRAIDWSAKPIAVHTHINQFYRYGEIVGDPRYSASSIQYDPEFAGEFVEQWRR